MNCAPTFAATAETDAGPRDAPDTGADWTERHRLVLMELTEIGMVLARELRAEAEDRAEDKSGERDLTVPFARVARAVRQTLALEARINEEQWRRDEPARVEAAEQARDARRSRGFHEFHLWARKDKLVEAIEPVILARAPEGERERLLADLLERVEAEAAADDEEFSDRFIGEQIADIRDALGLPVEPEFLADEAWLRTGLPSGAARINLAQSQALKARGVYGAREESG